jgi:multiple antibiotic resistance protein
MLAKLIPAFITLFIIIDPVGVTPLFAVLTKRGDDAYRREMAFKGALVAGGILFAFALLGDSLLGVFGISMAAFRIAGGLLLFLVSIEMIFDYSARHRSDTVDKFTAEKPGKLDDVSVFPLAIPFIAGPGSITSVILVMGVNKGEWAVQAGILGVLALILVLCYFACRFSGFIVGLIGQTATGVFSRLLGVITAAMSVQFVIDGIRAVLLGQ